MPSSQYREVRCDCCGYAWIPRDVLKGSPKPPNVYSKCKSPYWNTPQTRRNAKAIK